MADDLNYRVIEMEGAIRSLVGTQKIMIGVGGVALGLLVAVVGVNLSRTFTLGDRVNDTRNEVSVVGADVRNLQNSLLEVKAEVGGARYDVTAVRLIVERISGKMGIEPVAPEKISPAPTPTQE